ncbi:hypothetical protein Nepgr_020050 [Nepenthes gracilis]|uniref:Protein FAR1-RELATED SEQUENCE n=1 Tax=Nepenthes gracilis TaxID=150966 RepID=A0AAD3XVN4_NEPGR|nr:hypothetical protein Nepgr_020050 [Nepenthes gracilis]
MSNSPLMIQLAQIYTPTIFKMMQSEMVEASAWRMVSRQDPEYVLASHADPRHIVKVIFEQEAEVIECQCRLMETNGIICAHVFKVFIIHDVIAIPEKYILHRWTRKARSYTPTLCSDRIVSGDDKGGWSGRIMSKVMRNCLLVGDYPEAREEIEDNVTKMDEIVHKVLNLHVGEGTSNVSMPQQLTDGSVKGVKNRDGRRATKRPKSCLERRRAKKKDQVTIGAHNLMSDSQYQPILQISDHHYQSPHLMSGHDYQLSGMTYTQLLQEQHMTVSQNPLYITTEPSDGDQEVAEEEDSD